MAKTLRTGEVAKAAGVNVETLRYYERRGILDEPARRSSGYREYPPETVRIVRFVKRAQALGFTLDEIQELLKLRQSRQQSCADVRHAASEKITEIEDKINKLEAIKEALNVLVESCQSSDASERKCPILDALEDGPGNLLDTPSSQSEPSV